MVSIEKGPFQEKDKPKIELSRNYPTFISTVVKLTILNQYINCQTFKYEMYGMYTN